MSNNTMSPNMGLTVPTVSVDPGPNWAIDINASLSVIDSHNHSAGQGVQINPDGLNINSDLSFINNNAINVRSVRFFPQNTGLVNPTDIGCLYETGVDLYYNDGSGNEIRITQSGGVVGTPGSISGLTPPASATYVSANETFVWQSAVNTPANLDAASIILRNLTASSKGLTLNPPNAMGSDYSITLPSLPSVKSMVTMDTSGNMVADTTVDGSTIQNVSNVLSVIPAAGLLPTGAIIGFGSLNLFTIIPAGYLYCDGSSVSRTTYHVLFSVIGTVFGTASGTTFNLPDLRGRFLRGFDDGTGRDPDASSRTAMNSGGATGDNVGSIQGSAFASHTHTLNNLGNSSGGGSGQNYGGGTTLVPSSTDATGGSSETRPINAYIAWLIKT